MPGFKVVERDYANLYKRFISFGPKAKKEGIGAHGISWSIEDLYDDLVKTRPIESWDGGVYPSLADAVDAANVILYLAPETNGEVAHRAYKVEEEKVGLPLADLAEKYRSVRTNFSDLQQQPRRLVNSPCWSGLVTDGRAYSAFCINVERFLPSRTLA